MVPIQTEMRITSSFKLRRPKPCLYLVAKGVGFFLSFCHDDWASVTYSEKYCRAKIAKEHL
jgi:hypothetical protein